MLMVEHDLVYPESILPARGRAAYFWFRFLMLKKRKALAMIMPRMVRADRMLYSGREIFRSCSRMMVLSLGGSDPARSRRSYQIPVRSFSKDAQPLCLSCLAKHNTCTPHQACGPPG